ncbi:AAA family ATPase [Caballeronia sp. ATUFL_M1_KS5A]|uniref:AAA family ATPase n=1 Tax=Caballeronia sp. ATUFL_M1_KS5A TaxID=2921778 RepID=UPI002027C2D5|nr:AAA family ATPase [Caballeronia sp. ATUFL_M1_KS5A]
MNHDARVLFEDRIQDEEDRTWAWRALETIRHHFPESDHWTTGGVDKNYIDIRIGAKRLQNAKGIPAMFLSVDQNRPCLRLNARYAGGESRLIRAGTATIDTFEAWLATATSLLADNQRLMKGEGLNPSDFEPEFTDGDDAPSTAESGAVNSLAADREPGPTNLILFGPPGTGKTYHTVNEALRILDPALLSNSLSRGELTAAFDKYIENGQIVFATFHQSFSYEDFVEGLRATTENGQIEYVVEPGVFKRLCDRAIQGVPASDDPFDKALAAFREKLEVATNGELLMPTSTGKQFTVRYDGGRTFRITPQSSQDTGTKYTGNMDLVRQLYRTGDETGIYYLSYVRGMLSYLKKECGLPASAPAPTVAAGRKEFVIVIDEINRGNVSRVFGELITLIEPTRRAGAREALSVTLPYSKTSFSVPGNLHIIGTMNTADRSLANLDIALRRRFSFVEMPPRPTLLEGITVDGIDIARLLTVMNERIEVLLGRDHAIGHSYFMPLRERRELPLLRYIFRNKVVPLLQEYFFEDWERIQWVLNDHRKDNGFRFVIRPSLDIARLFGSQANISPDDNHWKLNEKAFEIAASYAGIIDSEVARAVTATAGEPAADRDGDTDGAAGAA